jgi:hypothetical protein
MTEAETTSEHSIQLQEPYRPRPIRCLEVWEKRGWRLKVYGIAYEREEPRRELIAAAKELTGAVLPGPAVSDARYGLGFVGVHDGRGENLVFVDWWQDENELHHHVFVSPSDRPAELRPVGPDRLMACVWDLAVICKEREAWVRHVFGRQEGPDVEAYLSDTLDRMV